MFDPYGEVLIYYLGEENQTFVLRNSEFDKVIESKNVTVMLPDGSPPPFQLNLEKNKLTIEAFNTS